MAKGEDPTTEIDILFEKRAAYFSIGTGGLSLVPVWYWLLDEFIWKSDLNLLISVGISILVVVVVFYTVLKKKLEKLIMTYRERFRAVFISAIFLFILTLVFLAGQWSALKTENESSPDPENQIKKASSQPKPLRNFQDEDSMETNPDKSSIDSPVLEVNPVNGADVVGGVDQSTKGYMFLGLISGSGDSIIWSYVQTPNPFKKGDKFDSKWLSSTVSISETVIVYPKSNRELGQKTILIKPNQQVYSRGKIFTEKNSGQTEAWIEVTLKK